MRVMTGVTYFEARYYDDPNDLTGGYHVLIDQQGNLVEGTEQQVTEASVAWFKSQNETLNPNNILIIEVEEKVRGHFGNDLKFIPATD